MHQIIFHHLIAFFLCACVCLLLCAGESLYTNIVAGVLSGATAAAVANPTDVLKVKVTCTGEPLSRHHGLVTFLHVGVLKSGIAQYT